MATQGRGNFPFISAWAIGYDGSLGKHAFRKTTFFADRDHAMQTVLEDWFFEAVQAQSFLPVWAVHSTVTLP